MSCPPPALRIAAAVVALLVVVFSNVAAAQSAPITLRVYDSVGLSPRNWIAIRAIARDPLREARIRLDWQQCTPPLSSPCLRVNSTTDIVVRMVDRHDTAVRANQCGYAMRSPAGGGFVSLSAECAERAVRRLAGDDPMRMVIVSSAEVLGITLAHELAHVLLPGVEHSDEGLFTGRLGRREWSRLREGDLKFLPEDIARLRAAARRR